MSHGSDQYVAPRLARSHLHSREKRGKCYKAGIEREPAVESGASTTQATSVGDQLPQSKRQALRTWLFGPVGLTFLVVVLFVALMGYGFTVLVNAGLKSSRSPQTEPSTSTDGMQMNLTANPGNVPNATQTYGAQPAKYTAAADGAKEFHFTAQQVMWEPVQGKPLVLAWTLEGTVPGPTIQVTAGDHLRITLTNHFPEATTLHWHGLEIPANQDGVPSVGQDPI